MKKYLFLAATAFVFAACTNNEVDAPQVAETNPSTGAVAFDTYTASATRAGKEGTMTTSTLKEDPTTKGGGFGVFAQHSDNSTYDVAKGSNFMWNQLVKWNSSATGWEYEPLKYWPNETGYDSQTGIDGAAVSDDFDRLSFFAYAPYCEKMNATTYDGRIKDVEYTYTTLGPNATVSNTKTTSTGILGISPNTETTVDPYVWYRVSTDPSKTVDLLWGVAPAGNLEYETVRNKEHWIVNSGMPLLNLIKPNKDQKMKFSFQHALSRIGFTVVGAFDQISAGGNKDTQTKVLVKEVNVYEAVANSVKVEGRLNLNNTAANIAKWDVANGADYTATPLFTVTGDAVYNKIRDGGAVAFASQPDGVTPAEQRLFENAENFFAVIPSGPTKLIVEITYYVQTLDTELAKTGAVDGSRVENKIKKAVTVDFQNGKAYNLKLILGLTSVKLDAEVADWQVAGDSEVNLPRNNE